MYKFTDIKCIQSYCDKFSDIHTEGLTYIVYLINVNKFVSTLMLVWARLKFVTAYDQHMCIYSYDYEISDACIRSKLNTI